MGQAPTVAAEGAYTPLAIAGEAALTGLAPTVAGQAPHDLCGPGGPGGPSPTAAAQAHRPLRPGRWWASPHRGGHRHLAVASVVYPQDEVPTPDEDGWVSAQGPWDSARSAVTGDQAGTEGATIPVATSYSSMTGWSITRGFVSFANTLPEGAVVTSVELALYPGDKAPAGMTPSVYTSDFAGVSEGYYSHYFEMLGEFAPMALGQYNTLVLNAAAAPFVEALMAGIETIKLCLRASGDVYRPAIDGGRDDL